MRTFRPCQADAFCTQRGSYPVPVSVSWPLVTRMRPSGIRVADGYLQCTSAMYSRLNTVMSLLPIALDHAEVHYALLEARVHCILTGLSVADMNLMTTLTYALRTPYVQSQIRERRTICVQGACLPCCYWCPANKGLFNPCLQALL